MSDEQPRTKHDLIRSFFAPAASDPAVGTLALAELPEPLFRRVVAQHNARVSAVLARLKAIWSVLPLHFDRLHIPTFEEFQLQLDDKHRRATIAPEYRKLRDFRTYRAWVLQAEPVSTLFRSTFHRSRYPGFIPERYLRRHCFVVGRSGTGKSEVLKLLALSAKGTFAADGPLRRDHSVVLIDPHGDLAEEFARQDCFGADFAAHPDDPDLIYLDPFLAASSRAYPTLNPLELHSDGAGERTRQFRAEKMAQQLTRVFQSLVYRGEEGFTANMAALLMPCLSVLLHRPGSTLFDLQRFLAPDGNADLIRRGRESPNEGHRFFFRESFGASRFEVTKGALSTKIQALLNSEAFLRLLAQPESTLDLEAALSAGKTLVVNCAAGRVGSQTSEAIGRFLVGMILGIAFGRAEQRQHHRTPIWLFVDEAQHFVSPELKIILAEARKYGLHLTLATQVVGQDMSVPLTRIVLGNTAVKIVGAAGADSHAALAREMAVRPEDLSDLNVGEFVTKCESLPAVRVRFSDRHIGRRGQMDAATWRRLRRFQIDRYYRRQTAYTSDSGAAVADSAATAVPGGTKYLNENPFAALEEPHAADH